MQHARPVGPASQNNAAAFSPEMAVGVISPMRSPVRERWMAPPLKVGWQSAQATHVQAAFTPDMVAGSKPDRSPIRAAWKTPATQAGWQTNQTTHVQAAFMPDMIRAVPPVRSPIRERWLPTRLGWQVNQTTHTDAPFTPEMADGWFPDRNRAWPLRNFGWSTVIADIVDILPDMTEGAHPDEPRLFSSPRLPQIDALPGHIAADFSQEMAAGVRSTARVPFNAQEGLIAATPDVSIFSIEMVAGSFPSSPRIVLGVRIALPASQQTHVSAALSPEMSTGWRPDSPRSPFAAHVGIAVSQLTHVDAPFSADMTTGWSPLLPRLFYTRLLTAPQFLAQTTPVDAAFSQEMIAGSKPDRSLDWLPVRLGWHVAQSTPIAAPFSLEMTAGLGSTAHLPFRAQAGILAATPDVQIFSVEMAVGSHPDLPRLFLAPKIALPTSQTTHIATAFSPDMASGSHHDRNRQMFPAAAGWSIAQVSQVDAAFSVDMATGIRSVPRLPFMARPGLVALTPDVAIFSIDMILATRPERPRLFVAPRLAVPPTQATHVQATFAPEMVLGSKPDQNRAYSAPKFGWCISQVTQTDARFSQEMIAGWMPLMKQWFAVHSTPSAIPPDAVIFSVDMVIGSHPDQPRVFVAKRIPLPRAQTSPIEAPFGQEMAVGSTPDRNRERLLVRTGLADTQTSHVFTPFGQEMVIGWTPVSNRELGVHLTPVAVAPDVPAFSIDMVVGTRPDRGRLFIAQKIALPQSQSTPADAPLTIDMVLGSEPLRNRERLTLRTGHVNSQPTPQDAPFGNEMTIGSQPDKGRERLPLRTGLSDPQTTPVDAAFSPEMVTGHHPDAKREFSFRNAVTGPWIDSVLGKVFIDLLVRLGFVRSHDPERTTLGHDPTRTAATESPTRSTEYVP